MIVNVIIPLGLNEPFSYNSPFELEVGSFVSVPFGNKTFIGVVVEINVEVKDGIKLKDVKEVLAIAPLQKELMEFMKWTSDYNLIPLGNVLKMTVNPVNFLRDKFDKKYALTFDARKYLFGDVGGGDDVDSNGCEKSNQMSSVDFDDSLAMDPVQSNNIKSISASNIDHIQTHNAGFIQTSNAESMQTSSVGSSQTIPIKSLSTSSLNSISTPPVDSLQIHYVNYLQTSTVKFLSTIPMKSIQTDPVKPLQTPLVKPLQTPPVKGGKGGSDQNPQQPSIPTNTTKPNQDQEQQEPISYQNGDLFSSFENYSIECGRNECKGRADNSTVLLQAERSNLCMDDGVMVGGDAIGSPDAIQSGGGGNGPGTPLTPLHRGGLEGLHRGGLRESHRERQNELYIEGQNGIYRDDSKEPSKLNPEKLKSLTKKQKLVVEYLKDKTVDKEKIFDDCNIGDAVLKNLMRDGIIEELHDEKKIIQNTENIILNTLSIEQQKAFDEISKSDGFNVFVLEGTTGSGKTEVYFHLIAKLLKETDRQVLILLPEIALTSQLISRFKKQFNFEPAVWHSEITETKKSDIFKGVLSGDIRVVIGTRSSLFLPFEKLGLIIVDEEHDASYKQSENGCYNGRDLAIVRAKINNIPVVLASATPSLETLINVDRGKYKRVYLPSRYGKAVLPDIKIIDMKGQKLKKDTYISDILRSELASNLANHKQSMLFMNRRGYAPVVLCGNCGEKIQCPNCSCNLSYHKSKNRLICHHCEYFIEKPKLCPNCQSEDLIEFGPGVEKIEKEVKAIFPDARTIVMASDTTDTNKKLEEVVSKILNNEVDIIIGTQLVAKGHHFPNLTLVGILDSDASLFGGDIRASERTYQLLTQVSGRAGREEEKGRVYFQSYNPDNIILQAIRDGNKELLLDFEKQNRELGNFPPFGKMATIALASVNEAAAYRVAKAIARKFPVNDDIEVLGPAPALMSKLAKMFRFNIIVKTTRNINIQKLLKKVVLSEQYNSNVRIKIEIDG